MWDAPYEETMMGDSDETRVIVVGQKSGFWLFVHGVGDFLDGCLNIPKCLGVGKIFSFVFVRAFWMRELHSFCYCFMIWGSVYEVAQMNSTAFMECL